MKKCSLQASKTGKRFILHQPIFLLSNVACYKFEYVILIIISWLNPSNTH